MGRGWLRGGEKKNQWRRLVDLDFESGRGLHVIAHFTLIPHLFFAPLNFQLTVLISRNVCFLGRPIRGEPHQPGY